MSLGLTFLSLFVVFIAVYWIGQLRGHRREHTGASETPAAALLGLLALLLAFSFAMAISRYDMRRDLEVRDANSIVTLYLRAGILPAPIAREFRSVLSKYTEDRLQFFSAHAGSPLLQEAEAKSKQVQLKLWEMAESHARDDGSAVSALLLSGLNEMIDLDAARLDAMENRLPPTLLALIWVVGACSLFTLGYADSSKQKQPWYWHCLMPLLFAVVISALYDLDTPRRGLIRSNDEAMIMVHRELDR